MKKSPPAKNFTINEEKVSHDCDQSVSQLRRDNTLNRMTVRKLILKMSLTADGFVGGPNGEVDWIFRTMDTSTLELIGETLSQAGVHIMGSRTFHDMAAYWPTSTDILAPAMNEIPKVVFSRNGNVDSTAPGLTTQAIRDKRRFDGEQGVERSKTTSPHASTWTGARVAGGDIASEIARLKSEAGKPILAHGGARFARSLVASGLIDEYQLFIHPVVAGRGLPLFSDLAAPVHLKLENSTVLKSGIIANTYTPL